MIDQRKIKGSLPVHLFLKNIYYTVRITRKPVPICLLKAGTPLVGHKQQQQQLYSYIVFIARTVTHSRFESDSTELWKGKSLKSESFESESIRACQYRVFGTRKWPNVYTLSCGSTLRFLINIIFYALHFWVCYCITHNKNNPQLPKKLIQMKQIVLTLIPLLVDLNHILFSENPWYG